MLNNQELIEAFGMSRDELVAWYENAKDLHPSIGFFPRSQVWYAEIVIGEINNIPITHQRIVGNGKSMIEAIGNCRKEYTIAYDSAQAVSSKA